MAITQANAFGEIAVTESVYPPAHQQKRHEHPHASVYLFLAGSCAEHYGTRDREYSQSSVVVNPAGVSHAVRYGAAGGHILNVEIGAAHLQRLAGCAPVLGRVEEARGGRVEAVMRQIHAELRRAELAAGLAIEGLVCELVAALARDARRRDIAPRWISRVCELLRESIGAPTSLVEIA